MVSGPQIERRTVQFRGRVQGVGFRFTVRTVARRHRVAGYVRNEPDCSVLLVVEGEPGELDGFLAEIADAMSGNIAETNVQKSAATSEFDGFSIRM